jgi:hypothetical protein
VYNVIDSQPFDKLPELGMGFHFGVHNITHEGLIILNGQYAISAHEISDPGAFRKLHESPSAIEKAEIVPSQEIRLFLQWFEKTLSNRSSYRSRVVLHESPPFPFSTQPNDRFARYSAFRSDRRVTVSMALRPGTYVTSATDATFAPTGYGNVGRYALPNLLPAVYKFDVTVSAGTQGSVGTVAPAFGQAGGGVEIELTHDAQNGSVQGPTIIPHY